MVKLALILSLIGWAPQTETNCVTTALFASGRINDVMHVDPDDFGNDILPFCYRKVSAPQDGALVVGFGTSADGGDYRRLLHVFYLPTAETVVNKSGSTEAEKFETGSRAEFEAQLPQFFKDMAGALQQKVTGEVEYYKSVNDPRCALDGYEEKLAKYVKEPIFFQTRALMLERLAARNADMKLTNVLPAAELIAAHDRIVQRGEELTAELWVQLRALVTAQGLSLENAKDVRAVYPLLYDSPAIARLHEVFYLSLARKQLRMALGVRELEDLPR